MSDDLKELIAKAASGQSLTRDEASHAITTMAIISSVVLANAARMELRPNPYECRADGLRRDSHTAAHASNSPNTSDRLCPASATSDNELSQNPATASISA